MKTAAQELQTTLDNLTPAQREMLAKTTVQDWTNAFAELAKEPSFWQRLKNAALQGAVDALEDFNSNEL